MPGTDSGEGREESNEQAQEHKAEESPDSSERRLSVFIFIATLIGSLLGAAADLSDATGLVVPILQAVKPAPRLRMVGSNTVLGEEIGLAAEWREAFEAQEAWQVRIPLIGAVERTVEVSIEGIGSVSGFEQALQGEVDLLVMSEPMPAERYRELTGAGVEVTCAAEIGYDVIAFVTDVNNPVPDVSKRRMASMLEGHTTNWSEVGGPDTPIEILARRGSGTTELVLQRFTGSTDFPAHVTECENNTACLNAVLNKPGSLYWVSTSWLHTQPPRYLRLILIPYDQWLENPLLLQCAHAEEGDPCFEPDHYPPALVRSLYMYVLGGDQIDEKSTALALDFLRFVLGTQGQAILENRHLYAHFDPPAGVEASFEGLPGFDQKGLNGLRGPCSNPTD
jgi:ABC-type phosphate transport system substrate-binding protein